MGGKQVTGQTGEWLRQGVPQTQSGLSNTWDLGMGFGTSGFDNFVNAPVFGKDALPHVSLGTTDYDRQMMDAAARDPMPTIENLLP